MSDENLENDTLKNEGEQDTKPEGTEELEKTKKAYESQKIRAEKAEKELKELKEKESKTPKKQEEKSETPKKEDKSNEPDYAKLAFLKGEGITHPDDRKIVMEEAERLKLPLTDILGMEHIKSKLKVNKVQREAEGGMPEGGGKGGSTTRNSVDYWVGKKDPKNPETYLLPDDPELRIKVVNANMERERKKLEFPE